LNLCVRFVIAKLPCAGFFMSFDRMQLVLTWAYGVSFLLIRQS